MSKRVKLDKSELIDIILEEVEAALTDEATSLGQKDPKYKKFPSTIFYADVDKEYRAILPVVEKLLEENPQDRPYIADALEMMMFNVREGIHGPEMDESRLDEEEYDSDIRGRAARKRARYNNPFPQQSREQALASSMSSFLKGFEKYEETGDERWLTTLRNYLKKFGGQDRFGGEAPPTAVRDLKTAAGYLADERGLGGDAKTKFVAQVMRKAAPYLPSNEQLAENEYREFAMKRLEALKAALENAKSELQRQRINIKIQQLARTMKDMGDALPSLEEESE